MTRNMIFSNSTQDKMKLSIMTLGIVTLGMKTLSKMTLSIMTYSIKILNVTKLIKMTHSIIAQRHSTKQD
jgi:hypothetical protein